MARAVALAASLLLLTAAAGSAGSGPRLFLEHLAPLTITGRAFPPHEHLALRVQAGADIRTRRLTTNREGRFTAVFRTVAVSRCARVVVRVARPTGTVTTLKRPPLPGCLPAATP
jgi:hypothetical protein